MADVILTVEIAEDLQRKATATAELRGETLSDVVRSALEDYVKSTSRPVYDAESALKHDPLLSLRFTGGPGNAAEDVEDILRQASDPNTGFSIDDDRTS